MQRLCDWVKGRSISVSYIYIYIYACFWYRLNMRIQLYKCLIEASVYSHSC